MGPGRAGHISLMLTGSMRERLELMLHTSTEPIWDQTHDVELPALDFAALTDYLELRFQATSKPIDERAVEDIVSLTDTHPKRAQHLAWHVWEQARPKVLITREDVTTAMHTLIEPGSPQAADFERLLDTLLAGDESDINNARALMLLAGSGKPGSYVDAHLYGLNSATTTHRALARLKDRGLVTKQQNNWRIVDPLLQAWLAQQDPLRARSPHPLTT